MDVIDNSFNNFRATHLAEHDKVEIIPATADQKLQYSKHIEGIEFSDMPSIDFPKFTKTQLDSVPDIIDEIPITEYEKKLILLDSFEYSASSNWSSTFSLDENNKLISTYHDIDINNEPFEISKYISKEEVMFVKEKEIEIKIKTEDLNEKPQIDLKMLIENFATNDQKQRLAEGVGTVIKINESNFYVFPGKEKAINNDFNNYKILPEERAKELKLISGIAEDKKENKIKGMKI